MKICGRHVVVRRAWEVLWWQYDMCCDITMVCGIEWMNTYLKACCAVAKKLAHTRE